MKGTPREVSPGQDESTERLPILLENLCFPALGERQSCALEAPQRLGLYPSSPRQPRPVPLLWFPQQNSHPWAISPCPPGFYLVDTLTVNLLEPPKEPHSPKRSLKP